MGFRRSKKETQERKRWKEFCIQNKSLLYETGLPLAYIESEGLFCDFLMHGYIDHHVVDFQFSTDDMNEKQFESFKALVWKYFEAGFSNPGIAVFNYDETQRLETAFPKQFEYK